MHLSCTQVPVSTISKESVNLTQPPETLMIHVDTPFDPGQVYKGGVILYRLLWLVGAKSLITLLTLLKMFPVEIW